MRTDTQVEYSLPITMNVVKTEIQQTFSQLSLDLCCFEFANGDDSMQGACLVSQELLDEDLIWDDPICQTRTET